MYIVYIYALNTQKSLLSAVVHTDNAPQFEFDIYIEY